METAVYVKNLTKKFGNFLAVNNISFEVKKGEIYGFLGPNGAGKTTTIRMLCGLLVPTEGEVYIAGLDIYKNSEEIKRKIGYMSQKFSLYGILTVKENMEFYAGIYSVPERKANIKINELLEKIELKEFEKRLVEDLPAGIKQRVALCCALIHEPEIIFLDEPTAGVDPVLRKKFWTIIDELSKNGKTVFVTTHYMDEVEYCTRVAFMSEGKIIKEGKVNEIKKTIFKSKVYEVEVENVITAYNILKNEKIGEISMHGAYLHIITELDKEQLNEKLIKKNIECKSIILVEPSIEDVFVKLIRN